MWAEILGWVMFGLVAGLASRRMLSGPEPMGLSFAILLGVVGSLAGGWSAHLMNLGSQPTDLGGWALASIGAIVLPVLGYMATTPRVMA